MELHMEINPVDVTDENWRRYVIKLNKSLFGLTQAEYNWFEKLREGLIVKGFIQSQVDKCVFFRKEKEIFQFLAMLKFSFWH